VIVKNLSKANEVALLRDFVQSLPGESYLRSALEPFVIQFEQGIYSDIVPSVRESWDARIEADAEAKEARAAVARIRSEAETARREACLVHARVNKIVDTLRELSGSVDYASREAKSAASRLHSNL
jgi:hypothetical protein